MPNSHEEDRDRVCRASRFWGVIWQIGDAAYYLGLLGSLISPTMVVAFSAIRSGPGELRLGTLALSAILFLTCFPVGFGACIGLKALAERRAGVDRR